MASSQRLGIQYAVYQPKVSFTSNAWALDFGAEKAFDGVGMLVEQAAESFRKWRGVMPTTTSVISELRG